MADWRQIQARIRKAKNNPDPLVKLTDLYQRTRDAMVAWELGCFEESAGRGDEAAKWYAAAHGRFRRADWKKKAEEALARLGVEVPTSASEPEHAAHPGPSSARKTDEAEAEASDEASEQPEEDDAPQEPGEKVTDQPTNTQATGEARQPLEGQQRKKRRRGRRGGRGRGRRGAAEAPGLPSTAFAESTKAPVELRPERAPSPQILSTERGQPEPLVERRRLPEPSLQQAPSPRPPAPLAPPQLPSERIAHGRSDPGLTSRMAHLESMLRRLVSSPLHRLDEAEEAPAGPGVFLLSESDQSTSYYVESCQTLRIGLANLTRGSGGRNVRGSRGGRGSGSGESNLKSRLADYLGINEAKVAQYMRDHCAVRWIQLDDDAPYLAQFAIGVLRAPLNFED